MHLSQQSLHAAGGVPSCRIGSEKDRKIPEKPGFKNKRTSVTAVTDPQSLMGETSFVNMVQRACTKVLLEPGDTRQQWKGEAAASFVYAGITSSCVLPTSSAGYWSPSTACIEQAPPKRRDPSEVIFLPEMRVHHNLIHMYCNLIQDALDATTQPPRRETGFVSGRDFQSRRDGSS